MTDNAVVLDITIYTLQQAKAEIEWLSQLLHKNLVTPKCTIEMIDNMLKMLEGE